MLRTKLLTAAAATALLAAPAAFAQEAQPQPAPAPQEQPAAATPAPAAAATPAQSSNVIEVLRAKGEFSTLLSALDQAQLTETLASRPAITIFAPTDAAFAALPEADRTRLLDPDNAQELRTLLLYHVIVSDVEAGMITGARGGVQTAANNSQVLLDGTGEAIKVDAATVTQADLDASNGSVFVIDQVLNPATSQASMGDEEAMAPAAEAAPAPAATETAAPASETVRPSQPGETAPNGQQPATTTTVQSPPVQNPTDGQVDDQEDPANPAPTPTPN
jgi:uncharacterized surface protein with fasciclin (FAS1) repeats